MGNKKVGGRLQKPLLGEQSCGRKDGGGISFGKTRFHQAEDVQYKGGHWR